MEEAIAVRPTCAHVDLGALEANFRALHRYLDERASATRVAPPSVIAVVKANAYGHGARRVALALQDAGARVLACADIEEGVALREAGVEVPILVFGALSVSDLDGLFSHALTPTLSTPAAAKAVEAAAVRHRRRVKCQLKIDTGMHRLGFRHDNLARTIPSILSSPHLAIEAVYTHFATADDVDDAFLDVQRARFEAALVDLQALGLSAAARHAANSAALLRDERTWYEFVRPGLLLYGIAPPGLDDRLALQPVMTLRSRVVAVKGIRTGDGVGYGLRFVASSPREIGVVPAGYADGLDTRLANRSAVLVKGRRAPVVGSVCMDMLMVDVTGLGVSPGDEVVIIGTQGAEAIDVRDMASAVGTIPYELLCRVGARIERVYDQETPTAGTDR